MMPSVMQQVLSSSVSSGFFPVVQATSTGNSAGVRATTSNVNLPSSVAAGEKLLVIFACERSAADPTTPAGWTLRSGPTASANVSLTVFEMTAVGGETSVTVSHGSNRTAWTCYRISGWQGGAEAGTAATGTSTTPNPPSLTPSWGSASTLWLAVAALDGATAAPSSYPSGYSGGISDYSATTTRAMSAQKDSAAASEDPGTYTTTSGAWAAQTIAIRPV